MGGHVYNIIPKSASAYVCHLASEMKELKTDKKHDHSLPHLVFMPPHERVLPGLLLFRFYPRIRLFLAAEFISLSIGLAGTFPFLFSIWG
jgi:hypothetical protein